MIKAVKHILYTFLVFLIFSCNNSYKSIEKESIFLDLSPKMNYQEFNEKLKSSTELIDDKFIIELEDNIRVKFYVTKTNDKIILKHNSNKFSNFSIDKLKSLYKKKYGEPFTIPHINLETYIPIKNIYLTEKEKYPLYSIDNKVSNLGFNKGSYSIFKDSIKTILIGITDRRSSLFYYKNKLKHSFDLEVEIIYMHNSDFTKTLKQINKEKNFLDKKMKEIDSIRESKNNRIKKNKEVI